MSDRQQAEPPTASFVVIAYNEAATIERSLGSILAQPVSKEVVVVDDGSEDGTSALVAALAQRRPEVRLIALARNRGRGFARRAGVEAARSRLIATVDADIVLPEDWWQRCLAALREADAVGGTAVPDGDVAYIFQRLGLRPRVRPHTTTVTGSNGLFRAELFERVGFDASLREGEDVALGHALQAAGAALRTVPGLTVEHLEHKSFAQTVAWLHQTGRGATRQLIRYRQLRAPDLAFAAWLAGGIGGARRRRGGRRAGWAIPLGISAVVAAVHVMRAFRWEAGRAGPFLGAVGVDTVLLNAYFSGRLRGPWRLRDADRP